MKQDSARVSTVFPGLLDAIIKSAARDAERLQFPQCELVPAG